MNTKLTLAAIAAGIIASSCGGHKKADSETSEQTIDVALPEVDSVTLSNTYPGELIATSKVEVVARVSGQLLSKSFDGGQYVQKGKLLFKIEDSKYRDAVSQADAALATAISERDYASSHYEAVKKALQSDAVSKMEVNQAESSLQQAEAAIKNAKAALETARTNLGYCTITAPISGNITSASLDVGNYVNGDAGAISMATIYDTSTLIANFAVASDEGIEP